MGPVFVQSRSANGLPLHAHGSAAHPKPGVLYAAPPSRAVGNVDARNAELAPMECGDRQHQCGAVRIHAEVSRSRREGSRRPAVAQ